MKRAQKRKERKGRPDLNTENLALPQKAFGWLVLGVCFDLKSTGDQQKSFESFFKFIQTAFWERFHVLQCAASQTGSKNLWIRHKRFSVEVQEQ